MPTGNRGEWSEFYAFLKILSERGLSGADEDLRKIQDIFFPVLKIVREEAKGVTEYEFSENDSVKILKTDGEIVLVDASDLKSKVSQIFTAIRDNSNTTFSIPMADELMIKFHASRLNAGNSRKEDIVLKIHDRTTGTEPEIGYSIKSRMGSPATLLNPSQATNFIYKISNLSKEHVDRINALDTRAKVRDRLSAIISEGGSFSFEKVNSLKFEKNLRKIETILPEITAQLVLAFYMGKGSVLSELIENLTDSETSILAFKLNRADHEFKIKNLLYNVALGMVPDTEWDGMTRAHGGYIIVREDGEIVSYNLYNADQFRGYLYKNTKFDTPSTSRYESGIIYEENGELYIKLTLQIRFLK